MTPAKPQLMTGQKDDADDLIAELTKLMATETKSGSSEPSRVAPPGAEPRPAPQTIRIPGMSQPVVTAPSSGTSGGAGKFDFGRPPTPVPVPAPEPLANWQDRLGARPAPPVSMPSFPSIVPADGSRTASSNFRPAITAEEQAPNSGSFDFDFGLGRGRADSEAKAEPVKPAQSAETYVPAAHDPIADLIAAELEAAAQPKPVPTAPVQTPVQVAPHAVPSARAPEPAPVAPQPVAAPPRQEPVHEPVVARSTPAPVAPPEADRFATAPVFGLGNRPANEAPSPKRELDPMDEIESLIGEAVRVELNAPQPMPQPTRAFQSPPTVRTAQPAPPPAPVVPPLTTQFAPRRTSLREPESTGDGADDAILAAAAATGAEVGRIDSAFADERPMKTKKQARRERPARQERQSGGAFRQLVVPAVAGTLLLAIGFGLYWALGMTHIDGKAPILTADATPTKQVPVKPATTDATHSPVLDQLSGDAAGAKTETLVSRDQSASADATPAAAPAAPATAAPADASDAGGLANRKVRTVTVRPDGTIVSGDDSVAGAAKLPVDRPNVPAVPGAVVAATDTTTAPASTAPSADSAADPIGAIAAADQTAGAPAATNASTATAKPATAAITPAADTATAPTTNTAGVEQPTSFAPVPLPRPTRSEQVAEAAPAATAPVVKPTSPVTAVIRSGNAAGAAPVDLIGNLASDAATSPAKPATPRATAPAPQAAAADASAGNLGAGHVQLSSQKSEADAQASASSLQRRFGSLFNGGTLKVVKVDLGAKGIYYRVMLPAASAADATNICVSIKAGGGDCVANR